MLLFVRAADRIQAYLLRDLLQMHGIKAHVFNEHMTSIVGDVPPDVAMPQVWLDDDSDAERARAVLERHARAAERKEDVQCSGCGEANPPAFELCWKCGTYIWPA